LNLKSKRRNGNLNKKRIKPLLGPGLLLAAH
jgi:hypothetical protein